MQTWYTLYTKPHMETRVERSLAARGFQMFLPLLPATKKDPDERPLFPCYLFVQCDLESAPVEALRTIPGLRRMVAFDGRPARVPDEAIELMKSSLRTIIGQGGLPQHPFHPGDTVRLDSGPLAGLRAIFVGPTTPADRVQILIRFLGEANRAEVPVDALRPVSEDEAALAAREEEAWRHRHRGTRGHGRQIR
jgi:transcription antitermination factor NusG